MKKNVSLLFLFFFLFTNFLFAKVSIPELTRPVEDHAGLLNYNEQADLERLILKIQSKLGVQAQVLIIPTLEDENLEEFSIKLAETWKIGSQKKGNGVILLITLKEHNIRIEVGNGIEGELTDYWAHKTIKEVIAPNFKQQNYYQGIKGFLSNIIKAVGKESFGEEVVTEKNIGPKKLGIKTKSTYLFEIFLLFFVIFAIIGPLFSHKIIKGMLLRGTLMGSMIGITSFLVLGSILIKQILLFTFLGFIFGIIGPSNILLMLLSSRGGNHYGGGGFGGGSGGSSWGGGGGGFSGGGSSGDW
ncbi:MAG: TPM domain-containing protein [Bacteriovoracaceae bacterium]